MLRWGRMGVDMKAEGVEQEVRSGGDKVTLLSVQRICQ